MKNTTVLAILDGYGLREEEHGNAVKLANNKVFENKRIPHKVDIRNFCNLKGGKKLI